MENVTIEARVFGLSDQLHRELASRQSRCWLLLDPVLRPVLDESPLGLALAGRTFIRLPSASELEPSLMPLLVEFAPAKAGDHELIWLSLHEALEELAPEALAQGGGRRICGWLESNADGKSLARHIAKQMIQAHGTARRLLRWYDPAVLWALWPLLKPDQKTTLLGPITSFRLIDPTGHWVNLTSPRLTDGSGLDLTYEQWQRIDCIAALNGALREFELMSLSSEQIGSMRDNAMAALLRARQLGFADNKDLRAFARFALNVHPAFDAHPLVTERLAKRESDDYFTALVDDLTTEQWVRIQHDCAQPATR